MSGAQGGIVFVIFLIIVVGIAVVGMGGAVSPDQNLLSLFSTGTTASTTEKSATDTSSDTYIASAEEETGASEGSARIEEEEERNPLLEFLGYRTATGYSSDPARSPYAAYVELDEETADDEDPGKERLVIRTEDDLAGQITVTGWRVESALTKQGVVIGSASELPFLGGASAEGPIVLHEDQELLLSTGRSPNGVSFRINKCVGYFEQFQDFSPPLPRECPSPYDEMLRYPYKTAGNEHCMDFIDGLDECTLTVTEIPPGVGGQCQDFVLNTLSYQGCITDHKNDPDFYENEWRVFLGRNQELWGNTHDRILLLDENGKLVDSVSY